MRRSTTALLAFSFASAMAASTANALNCYIVLDRNDAVVYQDTIPPVDMSDTGATSRAAMRGRGQFLMTMDSDRCPRQILASGPAGGPSTVEEIVSGMRAYGGAYTGVSGSARAASGATTTGPAAAPARK